MRCIHSQKQVRRSCLLLKDLALRCLRIAEVHHLIHELVDDYKVIPDGLLFQLFEVLDEDLYETMEEEDDLDGVGIPSREREHCKY